MKKLNTVTNEQIHDFMKSATAAKLKKAVLFKDISADEVKAVEGGKRVLVVKISTINPDRSGDTVQPKGIDISDFMKNPVVLFAHDYQSLPIAKCTSIKVTDDAVIATVEFPDEGVSEKSDVIYALYKGGFLNAWSIGFMPTEYEENNEGGYNFIKWSLYEFSAVPVPDNAEALTIMRSKGINVDILIDKTIEPELKDISEVCNLADVLSYVHSINRYFQQSGVNAESIGKLTAAEALIMEVIQMQAVIGEKSVNLGDVQVKSGRTISKKHEDLLKECVDMHKKCMDHIKTILDSVDSEAEPDNQVVLEAEPVISKSYVRRLAESLKHANRSTNMTLRLLNNLSKEK